jgi:hypothetical protein
VRLAEQLSHTSEHEVLFPGWPFDPGNWNKIPKWVSLLTLAEGACHFEHHEYVGLFRYGELRVRRPFVHDAGAAPFDLSLWSVRYPSLTAGGAAFASSDTTLNRVWQLCADTIKYTSLDTFTDSNVRERTPYEADGYITARSYWALTSERAWVRHGTQYLLHHPTWPTEVCTPLTHIPSRSQPRDAACSVHPALSPPA